jgi:hypothetical protein
MTTRGKWLLGCTVEVDMDGSPFDARIVRMPTDRDEAYVVDVADPDMNSFLFRVVNGRAVVEIENHGIALAGALHDLGFVSDRHAGWFLSADGKIRVIATADGTDVIAWTDARTRIIDWKAHFSGSTPTQVIICALTGAL